MNSAAIFSQVVARVRDSWRELVITDIAFKLFSFVVLAPLMLVCQRLTIAVASDGLLSDADFVYLFLHPIGIACGVLVASIWLGIVGFEQASLLAILGARDQGKRLGCVGAIRFAAERGMKILSLTGMLIVFSILVLLPVAVIAFFVYRGFLGEYDINFYLTEQPREFQTAVAIGGVLGGIALAVLMWLHSGWILALPIALFEQRSVRESLFSSTKTIHGKRWQVFGWIAAWLLFSVLANAALAFVGRWAGLWLIPQTIGSLLVLATRVGGLLIVLYLVSLAINLIAVITSASLMDTGYRILRGKESPEMQYQFRGLGSAFNFQLTGRHVVAVLGIGLLVAALIGYRTIKSMQLTDTAVVMAHRGASAEAPENTMAAFQLAIECGADWIELDVQESADGEVIVMHDSDFMKQSRNPLKVWEANRNQLADIDIGSWFDHSFSDQRVPTLAEVLELCRDRVGVNIELKYYGHEDQLEARVVAVVEKANMSDQVKVMSLKKKGVAETKAIRPQWQCGLLLSVHAGDLKKIDADFLAINRKFATREFVRRAHDAGKKVYVWTVNDPASMSQMLNRGVDGLLTDRPDMAKQVLAERAEMNVAERLLSEISLWLLKTPKVADDRP